MNEEQMIETAALETPKIEEATYNEAGVTELAFECNRGGKPAHAEAR